MKWDQIEAEWAAMACRIRADIQQGKTEIRGQAQAVSAKIGKTGPVVTIPMTASPVATPAKREPVTTR